MRYGSKKAAEILEQAVKETVQCSVPQLRNPRIVIFDIPNEYEGADVMKAASKQKMWRWGQCLLSFQLEERN